MENMKYSEILPPSNKNMCTTLTGNRNGLIVVIRQHAFKQISSMYMYHNMSVKDGYVILHYRSTFNCFWQEYLC